MKYVLALLAAAFMITSPALASDKFQDRYPVVKEIPCEIQTAQDSSCFTMVNNMVPQVMAQAGPTTTVQTSAPVTSTTVVRGGDLAASVIEWLKVAFGTVLAGIGTLLIVKIRTYFGILTTDAQKAQLQAIAINGINAGAAEIQEKLKNNPTLDINIKDASVAAAVTYVQNHGADTIKALGLDPKSGDAVEAIRARIETALNDPSSPTAALVTPASGLPQVNGVIVNGVKV